ncbi:hypothetical protein GGS20DRAFT_571839 [Poronia punctata]|nr:hypothetical protein GGS20DRAFT_571839 [Poronia punctata]
MPHRQSIDTAQDGLDATPASSTPQKITVLKPASKSAEPTQHRYRMTFHHIDIDETTNKPFPPAQHAFDLSVPIWSSSPSSSSSPARKAPTLTENQYKYTPHCCPPSSSSSPSPGKEMSYIAPADKAFSYNDEILEFLLDSTRQRVGSSFGKHHVLYIESADIIWASRDKGNRGKRKGHSSAVTMDHLALVRERGHVDHLRVEFRVKRGRDGGFLGRFMKR